MLVKKYKKHIDSKKLEKVKYSLSEKRTRSRCFGLSLRSSEKNANLIGSLAALLIHCSCIFNRTFVFFPPSTLLAEVDKLCEFVGDFCNDFLKICLCIGECES